MTVTLLVADDHFVIRRGIASLLQGSDITVVAEASSGDEAVELALKHRPDVVLIDVVMPDSDGLLALEQIREKLAGTRVVMLSANDNPTYVARAVALGASEFILKGCSREELVSAVRRAGADQGPEESSDIARVMRLMSRQPLADDTHGVQLTRREAQVLRHLALGLSNREIGRSLAISVETVKEHVQSILRKLDVSTRTQAAIWAVRQGMA